MPSSGSSDAEPDRAAPPARATGPLFSLKAIGVGAFFFSLLGAAIMLSINERRLGRPRALWGILAVAAIVSSIEAVFFPELSRVTVGLVSAVLAWWSFVYAQSRQGDDLVRLRATGGRLAGIGAILGWGLTGLGAWIVVALGITLTCGLAPVPFQTYEPVAGIKVHFSDPVTEGDAREVGNAIVSIDLIPAGKRLEFDLRSRDGILDVCTLVEDSALDDPVVKDAFRVLAERIDDALPHRPISGSLCDAMAEHRVVIYSPEAEGAPGARR